MINISRGVRYSGEARLEFYRKLGPSWQDLAAILNIPHYEVYRFQHGQWAEGIWAWLERQDALGRLPAALRAVDREQLAVVLERSQIDEREVAIGPVWWRRRQVALVGALGAVVLATGAALLATSVGADDGSVGGRPTHSSSTAPSPVKYSADSAGIFEARVNGIMAEGNDGEWFSLWTRPSTTVCSEVSPCLPGVSSGKSGRVNTGQILKISCVVKGQKIRNGSPQGSNYYEDDRWVLISAGQNLGQSPGQAVYLSNVFFARETLPVTLPSCY